MKLANAVALVLILAVPQITVADVINLGNSGKTRTANFESLDARADLPSSALSPEAYCSDDWQGTATGIIADWFWGGEYYAAYQDPSEAGCTNTYPFHVTDVVFALRNTAGNGDITINMQAIIYSVNLSDPGCPKPGVVLGRGSVTPVFFTDGEAGFAALTVDICVNGPYFAGVYCPDRIGPAITLDVGATDPSGSPFGLRSCASYNNYSGGWDDLAPIWSANLLLQSSGYSSDENTCTSCPTVIAPGYDLWQSARNGDIAPPTYSGFTTLPLPADFFGPGSDPFGQSISDLQPQPIETSPADVLGQTDLITRRLYPVTIPAPGDPPQATAIEIIALNLVSSSPIIVTYNGGQDPELWFVQACLSDYALFTAGLKLESWCCDGGVYSWLAAPPLGLRFTFTRFTDGSTRSLDAPANGYPDLVYPNTSGRWSAAIDPPTIPGMEVLEGRVFVDHDCDDATADIELGQSSQFVFTGGLGEPWFGDPCTDDYCPVSNATGDDHISRVEIGSIDNATGSNSYTDYSSTHTITLSAGVGNPFSITGTYTSLLSHWNLWIDWNNDNDFWDAGEEIGAATGAGPYSGTIIPPGGSAGGSYRMRVRTGVYDPVSACGSSTFAGETEDYQINVVQDLCMPMALCVTSAYIGMVSTSESPINISGCNTYSDYFDVASIPTPNMLYISNPASSPAYVGAWVDWNQDNDFDDANETLGVTGGGTGGPYITDLEKPPGTPSGEYRLRLAIDENPPPPCGILMGEVEDYKVVVGGCCDGRVGDVNASGEDEPTIGDVAELVDHLFIDKPPVVCVAEADVNQSGGVDPSQVLPESDITIGDIADLVNYLFIATPAFGTLPDCL